MHISAMRVTVNNVTTDVSSGELCWLSGSDGIGMAELTRFVEQGPLQHGGTDLGFLLQPRTAVFVFTIGKDTPEELALARRQMISLFKPWRQPMRLEVDTADGMTFYLDCHYNGRMAMPSSDRKGTLQKVAVEVWAEDPAWWTPGDTWVFNVGAGSTGWRFPLKFPRGFGSSTVDQIRTFVYPGTWKTSPIVIIKGPIQNPVITNLVNGEKLDFSGFTVNSGETLTVDTRWGRHTVIDQDGNNRISALSDDSDLTTFAVLADPDAPGGQNSFRVTGSAANATTEIYLQVDRYLYIGI